MALEGFPTPEEKYARSCAHVLDLVMTINESNRPMPHYEEPVRRDLDSGKVKWADVHPAFTLVLLEAILDACRYRQKLVWLEEMARCAAELQETASIGPERPLFSGDVEPLVEGLLAHHQQFQEELEIKRRAARQQQEQFAHTLGQPFPPQRRRLEG